MTTWFASNMVLIEGTFITFLVALSIQVPMRFGVFSFAGVAAYGIGAYTTGVMNTKMQAGTWPAIAAGVLLALIVSLLLAIVVQRLSGLYLAMATIAVTLVVGVVAMNGGELTGGATGLFGVFGSVQLWHIVLICLLVGAGLAWSERGLAGRRIALVRDDPQLAESLGINVGRYRIAAFLISGLLGSLAGGLEIMVRSAIAPANVGFSVVVLALTVVVIGGVRSWAGAAIGAVIFTWLPHLLQGAAQWQHLIYGVLVVLAAVAIPGGILQVASDLRETLLKRRAARRAPEAAPALEVQT
jgi:branched-chain amino acid transport system permease protein